MLKIITLQAIEPAEKLYLLGDWILFGDIGARARITLGPDSSLIVYGTINAGVSIFSDHPESFLKAHGNVDASAKINCTKDVRTNNNATGATTQTQTFVYGDIHCSGNSVTHIGPKFY